MADEQAALLAQIAALSGAINSHKSSNAAAAPPPVHQAAQPYWPSSSRGRGRGRGGGSSRGAARGGAAASSSSSSRNRSLVISQQPNSAQVSSSASSATSASAAAPEGWVKKKSTHNMSLVSASTFEKTEPARLAALAASQKPVSSTKSAQALSSSSSSIGKRKATTGVRRGDNMGEVIIDGVTFVFDATGTKLVKAASQPAASSASSSTAEQASSSALPTNTAGATAAAADATPLRTSVNGQRFVRTKRGNLISAELLQKRKEDKLQRAKAAKLERLSKDVAQRERLRGAGKARNKTLKDSKPKGLCSFFNLTGRCQRGLSCPFTHDITRLAICRGALRPSGCTLAPGTCLLSHKATPQRAPHCMHYLNAHACRNGDACLYTHPDAQAGVKPTTAPCAEFQRVGWCAAGKACKSRHTWECPELAREGKCERKGCRLQHVIRAGGAGKEVEEVDYLYVPPTGELDDEALFVRDDAAAGTSFQEEEEARGKRKRADEQDQEQEEQEEEEESGPTFKPRRKKAKEFTAQQDYIGFGDAEEEESDEEEGEGEEESVHSDEDMDVSEGDSDDMQVSEGQDPSDSGEGE